MTRGADKTPSFPVTARSSRTSNLIGDRSCKLVFVNSQGPTVSKDRSTTRQIRSHAVSTALALGRRRAEQQGQNFRVRVVDAKERSSHNIDVGQVVFPPRHLITASVDPFETLSINADRLTRLMHMRSSIRAGEPVFNANDAIEYQSLHLVFETGLTDGALTAALGLVMSLAVSGGNVSQECMEFSSVALQHTRKKLLDPVAAATPATIGTILLLLGVEYRTGTRENAATHLEGLRGLLQLCERKRVRLPGPLRRAIYWQDLFSSIFLGTQRIVDYKSFHPGDRAPKLCIQPFSNLPEGFYRRASRLGSNFLRIISEVAALFHPRANWSDETMTRQELERLCNTQADLEGRLHELRQSTLDDMVESCIIAAFLCVYAFWTDIWNSALIPRCLSKQLLHHIRRWQAKEPQHDLALLYWLLHIGKAFAIDAHVRHGLSDFQIGQEKSVKDLSQDSDLVKETLEAFIWSELFFSPQRGWFWERIDETIA